MNLKKILTPNALLLGFLVLSSVGFLVFLSIRTRIDPLEAAMSRGQQLGLLFVVHQDGKVVLSEALYLHPQTGKLFVVDVPVEAGGLIARLGKVAALSDVFSPIDPGPYRELVETFLGQPLPFVAVLELRQLERAIDLLGGLSLQVSEPLEDRTGQTVFLVPAGNVTLEGPKVVQYLLYRDSQEGSAERVERFQRFVQALLQKLSDESEWLSQGEGLRHFSQVVFRGFEEDGLVLLLQFLGKADFEGMAFLQTLGTYREVDGRRLLFPHFNGNLLREGVQQAYKAIESSDQESVRALNIKIELQNGTERAGLASRTAPLFQAVGIEVVRVGNADRRDYLNTVILDRKGRASAVQRVSQLIRATDIRSDISTYNEASDVDVTVILGMDFDGRFVRK